MIDNMDGENAPTYPLSTEEIRRKRIRRERDEILSQIKDLNYERGELVSELHKVQRIYAERLQKISGKLQRVIDAQQVLLKKVDKLLELDSQCAAYGKTLLGRDGHKFHHCHDEFGHEGLVHHCSCGASFAGAE